MPLKLVLTEGLLSKDREREVVTSLLDAFLDWHGMGGSKFLRSTVVGFVEVIPIGSTFVGLGPAPIAIVEWLTPSVAFASPDIRTGYIRAATDILFEAFGGQHPRERIWVHLAYAVDGSWGIGGRAFTNAELGAAVVQQ